MSNKTYILSPKDREVLSFLFKNKVSTAKMMRQYLFPTIQQSGMHRRLDKLLKNKEIGRTGLINEKLKLSFCYFLTKKGLSRFTSEGVSFKGMKLKSENLYHDLALTDIRYMLDKLPKVLKTYSENDLIHAVDIQIHPSFKQLKELRSDSALELEWKNKKLFVALEYEASLKAEKRYDQIFSNYHKADKLNSVLYVCKDDYILKKMIEIENKYNDSKRGIIYYSTLDNVFKNCREVLFKNRFGKIFPPFLDN